MGRREADDPDGLSIDRRATTGRDGLLREFAEFLRHNKKWWLIPVIVVLLLVGAIIVLGTTVEAPLTYTFH
jgi:hypothetical protein